MERAYEAAFFGGVMDRKIPYQIIRSSRKTIAIQIKPDGQVLVRCPKHMRSDAIRSFVESKRGWIEKHLAGKKREAPFTAEELERLRETARKLVAERLAYFAPIVGVTYQLVAIRAQHTRWGSCSGKGKLNFNCLLALVPPEVLDYVVVHELCHLKEMNHSARFWAEVKKILPDYAAKKKWLEVNGREFIGRLP